MKLFMKDTVVSIDNEHTVMFIDAIVSYFFKKKNDNMVASPSFIVLFWSSLCVALSFLVRELKNRHSRKDDMFSALPLTSTSLSNYTCLISPFFSCFKHKNSHVILLLVSLIINGRKW